MLAADPSLKPPRRDRQPCPDCGGNAALCQAGEWLRGPGGRCCPRCSGDHDTEES